MIWGIGVVQLCFIKSKARALCRCCFYFRLPALPEEPVPALTTTMSANWPHINPIKKVYEVERRGTRGRTVQTSWRSRLKRRGLPEHLRRVTGRAGLSLYIKWVYWYLHLERETSVNAARINYMKYIHTKQKHQDRQFNRFQLRLKAVY